MSVEEEVELKDLVAQTLESNGCLAKIRAQLRASIFLALDEDAKISKKEPLLNIKVKSHLQSAEGQAMFCIVREFLEFFNLDFTISVYEPESYLGNAYKYEGRNKIARDLGLNADDNSSVPLLMQLIKIAQNKNKCLEINLNINGNSIEGDSKEFQSDFDNTSSLKTDLNSVSHNSPHVTLKNNINTSETSVSPYEKAEMIRPKLFLDETFVLHHAANNESNSVHNSNVAQQELSNSLLCNRKDSSYNKDDTFESESSMTEDIPNTNNGIDFHAESNSSVGKYPIKENLNESQPVLKELKVKAEEKSKVGSPKSEKLKAKSSLNSLSDLPPIQTSKSRVNDILPSLYSKEFKDKSNLRELDKLFDMEAEYEEDFMCGNEIDLPLKLGTLKSDSSKVNLLDEVQTANNRLHTNDKSNSLNKNKEGQSRSKVLSDVNKPVFKSLNSNMQNEFMEKCTASSLSENKSVSECLEVNSSSSP